MTHVTCRLTAKNRDQLRNPTLGSRVWATFLFSQANSNPHLTHTRFSAALDSALRRRSPLLLLFPAPLDTCFTASCDGIPAVPALLPSRLSVAVHRQTITTTNIPISHTHDAVLQQNRLR